jgi:DNA polymerase elongation subunit (family B)
MFLLWTGSGEQYLDDPQATKLYIPINDHQCLVAVTHYQGVPTQTILPRTAAALTSERILVKSQMQSTDPSSFEYRSLQAQQLAYKVLQNSLYGSLGVKDSQYIAVPALMTIVCLIGQHLLQTAQSQICQQFPVEVVYGDTDSLMLRSLDPSLDVRSLCEPIQALASTLFPSPHQFVLERVFPKLILYQAKNYAALDDQHSVVVKGLASQQRSRCGWVRKIVAEVLRYLLTDQESHITPYVKSMCAQLVRIPGDFQPFAVSCKMGYSYNHDQLIQVRTASKIQKKTNQAVKPGDRVVYVVTAGSAKLCDRGEDPEVAASAKVPLDCLYYLDVQLRSSLLSVLEFNSDIQRQVSRVLDQAKSVHQTHKTGVPTLFTMSRKRPLV